MLLRKSENVQVAPFDKTKVDGDQKPCYFPIYYLFKSSELLCEEQANIHYYICLNLEHSQYMRTTLFAYSRKCNLLNVVEK